MARIVVLIFSDIPVPFGGAEMQAQDWARHLSTRHEVTMITRRAAPDTPLQEEVDGYTVLRPLPVDALPHTVRASQLPQAWRHNALVNFLRRAQRWLRLAVDERALVRCVESLHPRVDFLLAFRSVPTGLLSVRVGRRLKIPAVVWIRGDPDFQGPRSELRWRVRRAWNPATGVLVQSDVARRELLAAIATVLPRCAPIVAAKLDVVENGVSLPAPSDYCPDGPVLSVGRLVAHKRMDVVIDACARLNRPLIVAGAGPELAVLQEQATRLGANVRFTGFLSHDELDVLYRQASVLVLASESEGQPNAVLEGMAHARPVVVTPVGGIPDLVDDGVNGLLMPYGDPSALASALARLAEDPDSARRMGVAARQTVEQFTWERMISKLELTLERWR